MADLFISDKQRVNPVEWAVAHLQAAAKLLATLPGNDQQINELKEEIEKQQHPPKRVSTVS